MITEINHIRYCDTGGGSWYRITPDGCLIEIAKGSCARGRSYHITLIELDIFVHVDADDVPFIEEDIQNKSWSAIAYKILKLTLKKLSQNPEQTYEFLYHRKETEYQRAKIHGRNELRKELKILLSHE